MTIGKKVKEAMAGEFIESRVRMALTPAEAVKLAREYQGMSQNELAKATGIPQSTISAIEAGRVNLGVERAKTLARALRVHPAVLVFPGWDANSDRAA